MGNPEQQQQVVLITGCSEGGIGHALARAFAAEGCAVVATSRSLASMGSLGDDPRFFLQELDVCSEESIRRSVENALHRFGRIDVLVNNAGVHLVAPLAEVPMAAVEQLFNTNVYGATPKPVVELVDVNDLTLAHVKSHLQRSYIQVYRRAVKTTDRPSPSSGLMRLVQAVVPHMIGRRSGKIVNIGSVAALAPGPWAGVYTASKAAVHALTDSLRLELRNFRISVISVVPGAIRSNLGNSSLAKYSKLPEWKFYKPFAAAMRARTDISQGPRSTPAEEFAEKTVAAVLKKNPPSWFSYGQLSTILAILYYMPLFIRDFIYRMSLKC